MKPDDKVWLRILCGGLDTWLKIDPAAAEHFDAMLNKAIAQPETFVAMESVEGGLAAGTTKLQGRFIAGWQFVKVDPNQTSLAERGIAAQEKLAAAAESQVRSEQRGEGWRNEGGGS